MGREAHTGAMNPIALIEARRLTDQLLAGAVHGRPEPRLKASVRRRQLSS